MRPIAKIVTLGIAAFALSGCASTRIEPAGLRGDPALPRAEIFFVREFEEGNDWLSATGSPAERPEILANLNSLTGKMQEQLSRLGPTRVLMTSIPKRGLLVTGQILRLRDGSTPLVDARILIFDLGRSYHYPVTLFEIPADPATRSLDDAWDRIARTTRDFLRQRMRDRKW